MMENTNIKWPVISLNIIFFIMLITINIELFQKTCSNPDNCNSISFLVMIGLITIVQICILNAIILSIFYSLHNGYRKIKKYLSERRTEKMMKEVDINETHINDSCCICLDNMERGVVLKCNHALHKVCLKELIEYKHKLCPLCCKEIR